MEKKKLMSDCILHKQKGNRDGYASTNRLIKGKMRSLLLHRAKFCDYHNIPIESLDGYELRHTCDNPRCINPLHLIKGTHAENMNDMKVRNRVSKGERHARSVLNWTLVRQMRELYSTGNFTQAELAKSFGVGTSTVQQIVRGATWKN